MSGAAQNQGAKPHVHTDDVQSSTKSAQTTTSTDDTSGTAAEGGSNENQQEGAESSERQAGSPEPNCAICLGQLENKSFTDSCFHMFCFVCLQEWSKVKAECPLCKQPFKSIIHNVKSYNNYDQFYLDHHPRPSQPLHFGLHLDRSFRYRTTLTMDHRYFNIPDYRMMNSRDLSVPAYRRHSIMPRYRLRSRTVHPLVRPFAEPVSTTAFRRQIYESGRRVSGLRSTHRRRRASPDFFRSNLAQMHRLVPWLNRELNALLYNAEEQVAFVMELIIGLIKRFRIDSDEFYEHIHPYLHHNTRHFMHEFLCFARSPYVMHSYDTKAIYEERSQMVSSSDSSPSDSDVVVVVDDDEEEPEPGGAGEPRLRLAGALSPWRSPQASGVPRSTSTSTSLLALSRWDSPTPGPSWDLSGNSSHSPVNVDDSSDSDASTIIDPTYIAPEPSSSQPARLPSPDSSDGEDVIFLSYDKPWEERSPIQLSSGSDSETPPLVKALKQENSKRKKVRSFIGTSGSSHQSRDRAWDRSRSPTSGYHHSTSLHSTSSGCDLHGSCASESSTHRPDGHHKRRHHHEKSDATQHSSQSGHKEKRKSSHSHSSLPIKKRRHDKTAKDGDGAEGSAGRKKHKHRKSKDKREKRSRRLSDNHRFEANQGVAEGAASYTSTERPDHCKKHPSGHKKSRVNNVGDGQDAEAREEASGHQSDGLLSDTSTSSGNSSVTTTSQTDKETSTATYFSRQQRVQQVLQERHRQTCLPLVPGLMEMAPSWENITRLASMLASQTSCQLAALPGPSQSCSDPVIISTSSDDSDTEPCPRTDGADPMTSENMPVAKTVVVPCSSNPEVPTAAIDYPTTPAAALRSVVVDSYIDVESISSEEEISEEEVVDVESVDSDSVTEPFSSSSAQELKAVSAGSRSFAEVSVEAEKVSSLSSTTACHSADYVQGVQTGAADTGSVTGKSAEVESILSPCTSSTPGPVKQNTEPVSSGDSQGIRTVSAVTGSARGGSAEAVRTLSPGSVTELSQTLKPAKSLDTISSRKNPFSMKYILKKDVFMGSGWNLKALTRQSSAAQSSQDMPLTSQDSTHSQIQSPGAVCGDERLNHQPFRLVPSLGQFCSHKPENAVQASLPCTVTQHSTASYTALAESKHCTRGSPRPAADCENGAESCARLSPPVSENGTESCTSLPSAVLQQSTESSLPQNSSCSFSSVASQSSMESCSSVSQEGTASCSDSPVVSQQSSQSQEKRNCVEGKDRKLSDKHTGNLLMENSASARTSAGIMSDSNALTFCNGEDSRFLTSSPLFAQESAFFVGTEDKQINVLTGPVQRADFPSDNSHENKTDTDRASTPKNQNKELLFPEHRKSEDEEMDLLNDSLSIDDKDAEKLLDMVNTCVPSDQEKDVKDLCELDFSDFDEQCTDQKSQTDVKTSAACSNPAAPESQAFTSIVTQVEGSVTKNLQHSSSAQSAPVPPVAEKSIDTGIITSVQGSTQDMYCSSSDLSASGNVGEHVDTGADHSKAVGTAEVAV